jgi:hypothetical protein
VGADEANALYEQWVRWLEQISHETHTLFLYRDYWRGLAEMTQANGNIPPSTFFDALGVWYGACQATSIRRQLDRDTRSISFRNLLADMAAHPEVMTRERHVGLWNTDDPREIVKEAWQQKANANYNRFAGVGNDAIDPAITNADLERLLKIGEPVTTFVNKAVAHTDDEALGSTSTYAELNAAIDELGDLLKKYSSLLLAAIIAGLVPAHQEEWRQAFRVAWWNG